MCCSLTTADQLCCWTQAFSKWKGQKNDAWTCLFEYDHCRNLHIPTVFPLQEFPEWSFLMFSSRKLERNGWRLLKMFPLWQRGSIFMHQVEKKQRSYNIKYSQWCRNGWNILLFQQKTGGGSPLICSVIIQRSLDYLSSYTLVCSGLHTSTVKGF